jgi:hypothetical protein
MVALKLFDSLGLEFWILIAKKAANSSDAQ